MQKMRASVISANAKKLTFVYIEVTKPCSVRHMTVMRHRSSNGGIINRQTFLC